MTAPITARMDISVVIPTFNRAGLLGQTIPALMNQQIHDCTYEVIFVSNGSSDNTQAVLETASIEYPGKLRHFRIDPTGGPSAPRNFGIREARGDVIIILDDDVLPDRDLVFRHYEFHKNHPGRNHVAIGEVYVPPYLMDDPMSVFHIFPYDEVRRLARLSYLHFWTCNVSLKRQFMLDDGMFDEQFLYYEDVLCGHRLALNGMQLHFEASAKGQHLHQLKPSGVPAKGWFTGYWLYAFVEKTQDLAAQVRFGVLSKDLPVHILARRLLGRLVFRLIDNPVTSGCLRLAGATRGKRSGISDRYYRLLFRRNLLRGYYDAKRRNKGRASSSFDRQPKWADRGES